jgi:hypothetical protein
MSLHHLILAALLVATTPKEAAPEARTAVESAGEAYWNSFQSQMRESPSPRERAMLARFNPLDDPAAMGRAMHAAAQAAPTDPLVQMLWSSVGERWSGCPASSPCPEQAMAWARVEPENGLAWVNAFVAVESKTMDDKQVDAAIAGIAGKTRYDDHLIDFWLSYRNALAARPMPSSLVEMLAKDFGGTADLNSARQVVESVAAMSFAAALPLPMQNLMHACDPARHPQAPVARFENCARIGRGIVQSDSSLMSKMLGSALVRVSGFEDEADRAARRTLEWRQDAANKLLDQRDYQGYFTDLASTRSETRAQELLLSRHGIPLAPPQRWKSGYNRQGTE